MSNTKVPLHRRLVGMLYDFMLAGTLALIFGVIAAAILSSREITVEPNSPLSLSLFAAELIIGFIYMAWFNLKKSQTPGMWVWKLKLVSLTGEPASLAQVFSRYIALLIIMVIGFVLGTKVLLLSSAGALGLAILFLLGTVLISKFNAEHLALHEIISRTRLIDIRQ